jgi:hypothetical protein
MPVWAVAIAPWAEKVAHALADASGRAIRKHTPLTSAIRREVQNTASSQRRRTTGVGGRRSRQGRFRMPPACRDCGTPLSASDRRYCSECWLPRRRAAGRAGSAAAREQLSSEKEKTARGAAIARGKAEGKSRSARGLGWDPDAWHRQFQPALAHVPLADIMAATGLSVTSASGIRTGRRIPHPRHWTACYQLLLTKDSSAARPFDTTTR